MEPKIISGRRAVLKRDGAPDVSLAVLQHENGSFEPIIDGMSGAHWQVYTPTQLMTGNTPRPTLDTVWNSLLAKYPGYSITEQEEVVQAA